MSDNVLSVKAANYLLCCISGQGSRGFTHYEYHVWARKINGDCLTDEGLTETGLKWASAANMFIEMLVGKNFLSKKKGTDGRVCYTLTDKLTNPVEAIEVGSLLKPILNNSFCTECFEVFELFEPSNKYCERCVEDRYRFISMWCRQNPNWMKQKFAPPAPFPVNVRSADDDDV